MVKVLDSVISLNILLLVGLTMVSPAASKTKLNTQLSKQALGHEYPEQEGVVAVN